MTKKVLEERLIAFSSQIITISNNICSSYSGNHLSTQIVRSGTSVSLNYGEAQDAESRKDFIHKMKIILKELRETMICLKLLKKGKLIENPEIIDMALNENNELISIFVKSIQTAKKNSSD